MAAGNPREEFVWRVSHTTTSAGPLQSARASSSAEKHHLNDTDSMFAARRRQRDLLVGLKRMIVWSPDLIQLTRFLSPDSTQRTTGMLRPTASLLGLLLGVLLAAGM